MGHEVSKLAGEARLSGGRPAARKLVAGTMMLGASLLACLGIAGTAQAQLIRPVEKVNYDNRFEVYGGMSLDTLVAGRNLEKNMFLGGFEALGTYWLFPRIGLGVDLRGDAGTTPTQPNGNVERATVYQEMAMGGVQVRGPRNQHFALNYHGYFGATRGVFSSTLATATVAQAGVFPDETKPVAALGISLDINRSPRWALRIQPDAMIRHYASDEITEDFSMSAGIVYRFGKK